VLASQLVHQGGDPVASGGQRIAATVRQHLQQRAQARPGDRPAQQPGQRPTKRVQLPVRRFLPQLRGLDLGQECLHRLVVTLDARPRQPGQLQAPHVQEVDLPVEHLDQLVHQGQGAVR